MEEVDREPDTVEILPNKLYESVQYPEEFYIQDPAYAFDEAVISYLADTIHYEMAVHPGIYTTQICVPDGMPDEAADHFQKDLYGALEEVIRSPLAALKATTRRYQSVPAAFFTSLATLSATLAVAWHGQVEPSDPFYTIGFGGGFAGVALSILYAQAKMLHTHADYRQALQHMEIVPDTDNTRFIFRDGRNLLQEREDPIDRYIEQLIESGHE